MTIPCTLQRGGVNRVTTISWFNVLLDSVGEYVELPNHQDKTMHFYGTFGGSTVSVYGSNDPRVITDSGNAEWVLMVDAQANVISKTANSMELVIDNPRFIKVETSGGDGTTSINAVMCAKQ